MPEKKTLTEKVKGYKPAKDNKAITEDLESKDVLKDAVGVLPAGDKQAIDQLIKDREIVKKRLEDRQKEVDEFVEKEQKRADKFKKVKLESLDVKDRKELAKIVVECKAKNKKFKITRSVVEGYRYHIEHESLKESFKSSDVIDDLVDRAYLIKKDGHSTEDAVAKAIDDGLIYTEDILALLDFYGTIDSSDIISSYYDDLTNDITKGLEERLGEEEEEEEIEESKESAKSAKILDESLKVIITLDDYKPWSGAKDTWEQIISAHKLDDLDSLLEDAYPDGLTQTEVNDILWFDSEWVLSELGIKAEEEEEETEEEAEESSEAESEEK